MTESLVAGASAAPLSMRATAAVASAIVSAARQLLTELEQGRRIDATVLRNTMQAAFGGSDATGVWDWKAAYDACEAATLLFLRRHGAAMRAKAASPAAMLSMLMRIVSLLPTQTRRSEESQSLQQFSTPIGLVYVASVAAAMTPADVVLEPSAGTGQLAVLAELAGASLVLNEVAESRAGILGQIFPAVSTTRFDAAHINALIAAPAAAFLVVMAPEIMKLWLGERSHAYAELALQLLAIAYFFNILTGAVNSVGRGIGVLTYELKATGLMTALNLGLSLSLVILFGYAGALIGYRCGNDDREFGLPVAVQPFHGNDCRSIACHRVEQTIGMRLSGGCLALRPSLLSPRHCPLDRLQPS